MKEDYYAMQDILKTALPKYTSALPSILSGAVVGLSIFSVGAGIALFDRTHNKYSEDLVYRLRWILILFVAVTVATFCKEFVTDTIYSFDSVYINRQHYANLHWIRKYKKSILS